MNPDLKAKLPHPYLLALGLFLVFVGIRIHLVMLHASQTPYWDDWAMGSRMAQFIESGFDPAWMFSLTNEHRSMFSKLTNLVLFRLNDYQWDPFLTMVVNPFIWATSGVLLLYIGYKERAKINRWPFALLVIVLWTYPISYFNILSTIQTYLYYMVLFSISGFWLVTHAVFSLKWCFGVLLIIAACLTTGGGSFAPVAVTAVSCFLAIFVRQNRSQHLITAATAGVFAAFGLYLILSQGEPSPSSAKSLSDFFSTLFRTLSWPSSNKSWPSVFFLMPIILLAFGIIRKKFEPSRLIIFTLMMAAFGIMLAIAIAYARGSNGQSPSERYFDFLTIYTTSSALSLLLIQRSNSIFERLFNRSLALLWVIAFLAAVPYHLRVSEFQLNDRKALVPVQDDIMARYSVTADPNIFENREFRQVPFHRLDFLQDIMRRMNLADVTPYSLQRSIMQVEVNSGAFLKDGIPQPNAGLYRGLEHVIGSFTPSLEGEKATGKYTSEIFIAKRPYVMIPFDGFLGYNDTSLSLVGEDNGEVVEVKPRARLPRGSNQWHEVLVKAPDRRFRIVASDNSTDHWFAYAAPRSVGRLSYIFDRVIQKGDKIWMFGLFLIGLVLIRQFFRFGLSKVVKI